VEDRVLFEIQKDADITLVRCSGRIVQGDGAADLLRAVMAQESRRIQIDLSRVNSIDAGGLGVLARLARWAKDGERSIQLVNPSKRVRAALESTRLNSVLQVSSIRTRGEAA
jgi:anti-anti-sigma factor